MTPVINKAERSATRAKDCISNFVASDVMQISWVRYSGFLAIPGYPFMHKIDSDNLDGYKAENAAHLAHFFFPQQE